MSKDGKILALRPNLVAYVSVRRDEVLTVEDITEDNPDYSIVNQEPRKRIAGSIMVIRGFAKPLRTNDKRADVLRKIDPDGTLFAEFTWQDPDGRRSG